MPPAKDGGMEINMEFEIRILDFIQGMRTPLGDWFMPLVSSLGNTGIIWIVLALVLLAVPKTRKAGAVLAAALSWDVVLCDGILKHLFARVRPCDINTSIQLLISRPWDYSFPSGHTAAMFAAAVAFTFKYKVKGIPVLIVATLVALSRIYLCVHYPTDVFGGFVIGSACGAAGYFIAKAIEKYVNKRKKRGTSSEDIGKEL